MVVTGSESPIVVVLSGSMEPAFHRGDLLFLTNHREEPIRVGEIVVFKVEGREIPIVHRVIKVVLLLLVRPSHSEKNPPLTEHTNDLSPR